MIELAILVALAFALGIATVALLRVRRLGRVTLLDWSLLAIAGVYGSGWSLVIAVTAAGENSIWAPWILADRQYLVVHTAGASVLAAFIWFGWVAAGSLPFRNPLGAKVAAAHSPEALHLRLGLCAWVMLLAAVSLQLVYSRAYGGLAGILEYANSIRSGIFEVHNPWSFLNPFTGLALFAAFVFYGMVLSPARRRPWLGFVLSASFSVYLLYSWLGRIGFLAFFATFVLGHMLHGGRKPMRVIFGGATILGAMLVAAYYLSAVLNLKFVEGLPAYLAGEIAFPFASFLGHLREGPGQYRWFIDFVAVPLYFLPSSLWMGWFEDVARVNTTLIMGAPKGEAGVTGAIPVDLLTLGLLQASMVGVAAVGAAFGMLLRVCQHAIDWIPHSGVRAVVGAHLAIKLAVLGVFYAQPDLVVRENIHLMVGAAMMIAFLARPRTRAAGLDVMATTRPPRFGASVDAAASRGD